MIEPVDSHIAVATRQRDTPPATVAVFDQAAAVLASYAALSGVDLGDASQARAVALGTFLAIVIAVEFDDVRGAQIIAQHVAAAAAVAATEGEPAPCPEQ